MNQDIILSVKNLTVSFNGSPVLDNISFDVKKGDILVVIGPNGAGKTVLFRALLGLIPYQGDISWQNDISIGYVPQRLNVAADFPLVVEEFLQLSPPRNKNEELYYNLRLVGFNGDEHHLDHHLLKRRLGLLSSGELQRVLIANALLDKPDVLLFDEPTSGVDVGSEEAIYERLKKLNKEGNFTMILISHDLSVVNRWATAVLCLNQKAVCFGPPHSALGVEVLKDLYGGEKAFYKHQH